MDSILMTTDRCMMRVNPRYSQFLVIFRGIYSSYSGVISVKDFHYFPGGFIFLLCGMYCLQYKGHRLHSIATADIFLGNGRDHQF